MLQVTGYPTLEKGLEYLKKYVSEAEDKGQRITVFCEDRLTLLAEQTICRALGGSFLTSVTTFARFLRYSGKKLSKQGSIMAMGKLLSESAKDLKCLSFYGGAKNGAAAVYEMISQLFASKVTGEMLLNALPKDRLLREKLCDLALLYEKYEDFLNENGYMDESRYLLMLPEAIRQNVAVRNGTVIFFGFSSFTAQALDGVRTACETADNVLGLLPAGATEIYANQAATSFKKICEEYGEVKISQIKIPAEYTTSADILRGLLYHPEVFSHEYTAKNVNQRIQIRRVTDEEAELRFVCAGIRKYIATGGRYSDVAVLLPDIKTYSLLLAKVFGEYEIPYFVDLRKNLSSHPFSFFLLAILRAVSDGGTPVSVEQIASSCYFGDNGQYRNYLKKFCNYRGGFKKEIKEGVVVKEYDREYLIFMRERIISGMGIFSRKMTGKDFCLAVRKLYAAFDAERITQELISSCDDDMQKEYLSKMGKVLDEILQEAEELLRDTLLSAADFALLLEDSLKACEVALLPLKQDEVFVGSLSESRSNANALVFALGMTDAVPLQGEDTALLSDKEMQKLETLRIKIEPSVAQVNARMRENICLNICSFTDSLYLLYPTQTGEERSESDILRYVERIFSDTQSKEDLFVYECSKPMPALKELLLAKEAYREGRDNSRIKYTSLYTVLTSQKETKEKTERLFEGKEPVFFIDGGDKLFFSGGEVSPTLLENYYTCPYRNFTAMGLKLKEREETTFMSTDAGIFVHRILELTARNVDVLPDEKACAAFAEKTAEELFQTPQFSSLSDTAAGGYTSRRLMEESTQVALEMYRQIKNSNFKIKYVEYDCKLPQAHMHGKIDRVDECGDYVRIVDYKTGNIDDSPSSYYVGKKLQLQLYMSAVSEGKIPAGIYYFPASLHYCKEGEAPFRMLGFMNGNEEVIKNSDTTLQDGEKSLFFNASLGKNSGDKIMNEEEFRRFIAYSVLSSRQGEKELQQGFIAPTPYADSCRYCAYKGMCAALGEATVRQAQRVTCKEIADVVQRETEARE